MMNLLWRGAKETVRELGLNVPTAVKAILIIVFTTVVVESISAPETDSITGFEAWSIKSLAWLAAVSFAFLLLWVWNIVKVARWDRSTRAQLRMTASTTASVDDQMKSFVRNNLRDPRYGVAKCYVFGSVVGQYPTRDVDIIIQFDSSSPGRIRIYRERLRSVERSFREFYNLHLHVQTFLSVEDEALRDFLNATGLHECLIQR